MRKLMITILLISIFLTPQQSFALSCVEPSPPDIAYNEYDAVMIGIVQGIKENNGKRILTIEVNKSFKGVDERFITVEEDFTWGESQVNFEYLYYLNKEKEKWIHPLCSSTTNNINIADQFFADKEEIPLKDNTNSTESMATGVIGAPNPPLFDNIAYIPIRDTFQVYAQISWVANGSERFVKVERNGRIVELHANKNLTVVNGKEIPTSNPIKIIDGQSYIPLRLVGEALGADVVWNNEKNLATISFHNQ